MKRASFFSCTPIILAMVSLGVWGCLGKSPPARFYALTPLTAGDADARQNPPGEDTVVGIGPVTLADYLDQPRIVTREDDNRLVRAEYDHWAGSFKDNLTSVMAENVGALLRTPRVYRYPWRRSVPVDYQIVLDIVRLDGRLGREALLVARWSVFGGGDNALIAADRASIREPASSGGYAALAAAQSRALASLSREIVEAIRSRGPERRPRK